VKKKIKISVIIPAYNQEKFIGRCLRSLYNQTLDKSLFEVIVINDASNDKTSYAISLFHKFVKKINNEQNLGLPASVNLGIKKSIGKYIVRVDADDYVNENFLKFLMIFLEENKKKYDAIACDYWIFADKEKWIKRIDSSKKPIACGILFNKKHIMKIGMYDETFLCMEDKELRIRYEKKYRIGYLELPLYRYRQHHKSLTKNLKKMHIFNKKLKAKIISSK